MLGDFFPLDFLWIYSSVLFPHVFFWSNVFCRIFVWTIYTPPENSMSAQQHSNSSQGARFDFLYGPEDWGFLPYWAHVVPIFIAQFHTLLCIIFLCNGLPYVLGFCQETWSGICGNRGDVTFFGGGCSSWEGQIRPDVHRKSSKWIRPGLRWPASLGFFVRFSYNEWYEVISIYCILMYSLSLSSSISLCHLSGRFSRVFTLGFFGDFLQGTRKHIQPNVKLGKSSFLIPVPADMGYVIVPFWGVYFLPSYYVGIIYFLAIFRMPHFFATGIWWNVKNPFFFDRGSKNVYPHLISTSLRAATTELGVLCCGGQWRMIFAAPKFACFSKRREHTHVFQQKNWRSPIIPWSRPIISKKTVSHLLRNVNFQAKIWRWTTVILSLGICCNAFSETTTKNIKKCQRSPKKRYLFGTGQGFVLFQEFQFGFYSLLLVSGGLDDWKIFQIPANVHDRTF